MLTGKPTRSEDYASDPRVPASHAVLAQQTGMVCVMVVPIVIQTQVAGLLYISNRTRRVFTDEDETVCTRLAEQAAIAIQNAELFARQAAARQEAEAASSAKDEFLAMLGHELGIPSAPSATPRMSWAWSRTRGRWWSARRASSAARSSSWGAWWTISLTSPG